ncbi:MAG: hypothetical protein LBE18_01350 [Planctomycetaceae bacterium]|jgi:hypothetical protein|nr:hypothetical protein [Planctomycetaceae bacterium]
MDVNLFDKEKSTNSSYVVGRGSTCIRVPVVLLPLFRRILSRYREIEKDGYMTDSYMLSIVGNEFLEKFNNETNLIKFEFFSNTKLNKY